MKYILIAVLSAFSISSYARQYIQCSNISSSDPFYTVINLTNSEEGTLFATPGVETDEHVLLTINKTSETDSLVIFKTESDMAVTIEIKKSDLGKNINDMTVELVFSGVQLQLGCFSRIYND
jgi:hypothetical protein